MKIYFAGPLFTWGEREQNKQIVAVLREFGHEVFLPQETEVTKPDGKAIFDSDMAGLDWSEVVVACMDGPDPDSGTCFEAGQAYRHKPIITYRTDIRDAVPPNDPYNLMLTKSADIVLDCKWLSTREIADAIHGAILAVSA